MSRPVWCIFCAQMRPPGSNRADGYFDGDPACTPCYDALSRNGTVGEWVPIAQGSIPEPMPSMTARATKHKGLQVRVRPGDPTRVALPAESEETTMQEPETTRKTTGRVVTEDLKAAILAEPASMSNGAVARKYGVSDVTVGKYRRQAKQAAPPTVAVSVVQPPELELNQWGEPAGVVVTEQEMSVEEARRRFPGLSPEKAPAAPQPPSETAIVPLEVNDAMAIELFTRLPLALKAKVLATVAQPLFFS